MLMVVQNNSVFVKEDTEEKETLKFSNAENQEVESKFFVSVSFKVGFFINTQSIT